MPVDEKQPGLMPADVLANERKRMAMLTDARNERRDELATQEKNQETPFAAARRRIREQQEAAVNEAAQAGNDFRLDFQIPWLEKKVKEHDKFVFALTDLENKLEQLQIENEHLSVQIDEASRLAAGGGAGGNAMGSQMINIDQSGTFWRYDKEAFGWFKVDGTKLWIYPGKLRDVDTYYDIDSQALTLSDTGAYVYVRQNRVNGNTAIELQNTEPDDADSDFKWPLLKLLQRDPRGDGDYTYEPVKVYHTGDIHRKRLQPDGESPYPNDGTVPGTKHFSLQIRKDGASHHWDAEMWQFHDNNSDSPRTVDSWGQTGTDTNKFEFATRYHTDTNANAVRYVNLQNFRAKYADSARFAASADTVSGGYVYLHSLEDHDDYSGSGGGEKAANRVVTAVSAGEWEWKLIGDAVTSDTGLINSFDSRWWPNTDYANPDSHDYRTTGDVRAQKFRIQNDTANTWTANTFDVDITGNFTITNNSTGEIISDGSKLLINGGGASGLELQAAAAFVNLNPSGNLEINGTAGWSGTFQVTQSGVTKDVTVTKGIITDVS